MPSAWKIPALDKTSTNRNWGKGRNTWTHVRDCHINTESGADWAPWLLFSCADEWLWFVKPTQTPCIAYFAVSPAPIQNYCEMKTEMLKIVGVCIDGAEKVSVCYHCEQKSFWNASREPLINREWLGTRGERESFQFDTNVIPREFGFQGC
jgi:hypothetical protein